MSTESQEQSIEDCPICKGIGSIEVCVAGGYRIDPCKCALAARSQRDLLESCIPRKYRDWDFRNIKRPFKERNKEAIVAIKRYVNELATNLKLANGIWISAPSGLSKNAFLCHILKSALEINRKAYYISAAHLLSKKLDSWKDPEAKRFVRKVVNYADVVAIADIEKLDLTNNQNNFKSLSFYELLSDMDENCITLLISSNMPKGNVLKKMPIYMRQRLNPLREVILRYTSTRTIRKANG